MKVMKAKCGASNPPAQKPKMAMGGYMKIDKPKKLGAYGGGYMNKKKNNVCLDRHCCDMRFTDGVRLSDGNIS